MSIFGDVLMGMLNPTHSLTHSLTHLEVLWGTWSNLEWSVENMLVKEKPDVVAE